MFPELTYENQSIEQEAYYLLFCVNVLLTNMFINSDRYYPW